MGRGGKPFTRFWRDTEAGDDWTMTLKGKVRHRATNLLNDVRAPGRFDAIFCRNKHIAFGVPTKKRILDRMVSQVEDPGFPFLGAAETILGVTDAFKPVSGFRGLYARNASGVGARFAA